MPLHQSTLILNMTALQHLPTQHFVIETHDSKATYTNNPSSSPIICNRSSSTTQHAGPSLLIHVCLYICLQI